MLAIFERGAERITEHEQYPYKGDRFKVLHQGWRISYPTSADKIICYDFEIRHSNKQDFRHKSLAWMYRRLEEHAKKHTETSFDGYTFKGVDKSIFVFKNRNSVSVEICREDEVLKKLEVPLTKMFQQLLENIYV